MEDVDSAGTGAAKDPDPVKIDSSGEFWETKMQKRLSENAPTSAVLGQRFSEFRYKEVEGPRRICSQLHRLCRQWLKPEQHTKTQILDLVILEQFLTILPPEMESWVRECGPETSSQAVALAEGFLLSQAEQKKQEEQQQDLFSEVAAYIPKARRTSQGAREPLLPKWIKQEEQEGVNSPGDGPMTWPECRSSCGGLGSTAEQLGEVTFEEVAVYFINEDWSLQDLNPRALHGDVMEEKFGIVAPLGDEMISGVRSWSPALRDRTEGSSMDLNEGVVTFEDVAVYFNEEELALLGPDERSLHRAIMEENFWNVASVVNEVPRTTRTRESARGSRGAPSPHGGSKEGEGPRRKAKGRQRGRKKPLACQGSDFQVIRIKDKMEKGKERHKCPVCEKSFSSKSTLNLHWKIHTGEKLFQCLECGKSFSCNSSLKTHQRMHTGEKPFKCGLCGKTFTQRINLSCHVRIHTGERPYPCFDCGKRFKKKGDLSRHQRIHTGEKPYTCLECGMNFCYKESLKTHQRVHTGEQPFKCLECGKNYSSNTNLAKHQLVHTGAEEPYKCLQCGKSFWTNADLVRHQRIHVARNHTWGVALQAEHRPRFASGHPHRGETRQMLGVWKDLQSGQSLTFHQRVRTGEF
uniref:Zinc finger protein with KRAB and SCAN domains 1-like isoform X1 n=1 Tax=Pogona vitticeps TaxID=103695 RepID=A0ABM5FFD3_9SAUR